MDAVNDKPHCYLVDYKIVTNKTRDELKWTVVEHGFKIVIGCLRARRVARAINKGQRDQKPDNFWDWNQYKCATIKKLTDNS